MKKTKFMTRIFSAIQNNEDQVLEQLDKDIDIAKEDGICEADQYTITSSDDGVVLHDKVNDEDTRIIEDENGDTTFAAVDIEGNEVNDETLPLIEASPTDSPLESLSDDEFDETVELMSVKASKVKSFSLESLRKFAKGGWRDGKLYIKMGDSDVALDLKNKVAIVIDENLSCPIDPKKSFIDNLTTVEKFMKENDLKVFSDRDHYVIATRREKGDGDIYYLMDFDDWDERSEKYNIQYEFHDRQEALDQLNKLKNEGKVTRHFSDNNPTPEQEGVIDFLKGFVEEHPGEAKYLVELGAKWGPDNLIEGLNHDAEGDKTFAEESAFVLIAKYWNTGRYHKWNVNSEEEAIKKAKSLDRRSIKGIRAWIIPTKEFKEGVYNDIKRGYISDTNITKLGYKDVNFSYKSDDKTFSDGTEYYVVLPDGYYIKSKQKYWTADQLIKKGLTPKLGDQKVDGKFYEVALGPFKTKDDAEEAGSRMAEEEARIEDEEDRRRKEMMRDPYHRFSNFSPAVAKMFSSDSLVRQAAQFLDRQGIEGAYGRHKSKLKEEFHLTDDEVDELVDALYEKYGDEEEYDPKFGGPTLDSMGRRTVHHNYSNKFSNFSPAVAKMFASYDDPNEVKHNLRKSVKDAIGSLGLQVPYAKFENGKATITMKIHHDKVDDIKKAISGLRSDIVVTCKCSDPSKTDLTWYDLIFVQK